MVSDLAKSAAEEIDLFRQAIAGCYWVRSRWIKVCGEIIAKHFQPVEDDIDRLTKQQDRLRYALRRLLGQVGNIEVLGEWVGCDINRGLQKKTRATIEAVVAECREALFDCAPSDPAKANP